MPIGVQSFEKLITNDFVYIDKTELIWKLLNDSRANFLSRHGCRWFHASDVLP